MLLIFSSASLFLNYSSSFASAFIFLDSRCPPEIMGFLVISLLNLYRPSFSLFLLSVIEAAVVRLDRFIVLYPRTKAYNLR
jgi:hypothetical protein